MIVDVFGYFSTTAANGFIPVNPARLIDTRSGAKPAAGQVVTFQVAGINGVPADAPSVVLNLTLDQAAAPRLGGGRTPPAPRCRPRRTSTSAAGETRPNVVFAPVGAGGRSACTSTRALT